MSENEIRELLKDFDLSFLLPQYDVDNYLDLLEVCKPYYQKTEREILLEVLEVFNDDCLFMTEQDIIRVGNYVKRDRELNFICNTLGNDFIRKFLKKNR